MSAVHILIGSGRNVAKRWRDQYGSQPYRLADGRDTAKILRRLDALKRPTKKTVNAIIGDNSWTDIWCGVCNEYTPKAASFGCDYTTEVCEPCLRVALEKLTKTEIEK